MNEAFKPNPDLVEPIGPVQPALPPSPPPGPSRRRGRWVGRGIGLIVLLAAALLVWHRAETPTSPRGEFGKGQREAPPQAVRVASVTKGDMPITVDALGTVTPFGTVTIRTQIAGKLMEIGFTEGQMVKKGDFIAQIDPRPYQAALAQAQGQLAKDQAVLGQAESDLVRYETLNKQDSIAKQQVVSQQALVAQDKAAVAIDEAQVDTAQLNLNYTRIASPITGRAGLRLVDPGNYLQPSDSTGIVVITQMDPISVVFSIPEDDLPRIAARLSAGAKLETTVFDRANVNKLATGTLTTYDSQVDVTTGTIKMRATFDNSEGLLFPNQFVNVRLLVDTLTGVTLAPNAAIQIGPSGDFVYLLNADSTVSKRDIEVGPTDHRATTITKGLAPGDQVVVDGVDRLRDGARVRLAGDAPQATAPAAGARGSVRPHRRGAASDGPPTPKSASGQ